MSELSATDRSFDGPEDFVAFILGGREVVVEEVVRAAHFRGAAQAPWLDFLRKIACAAQASLRGLEPDADALQALADEFRYGRDLITAEETERWFELRGLSAEDFSTHISRSYWKEAMGNEIVAAPEDFSAAEAERRAQLTVDLLLTGAFNRMARDLAWRLAASRSDDAERIEVERTRFFARSGFDPAGLAFWLEAVGGNETWFEEMLVLEANYRRKCEELVTPERLARELRSQRLALMRFEVEEIEFDTMEAAREALLCVREDGLSMEEVAEESRYPYTRHDFIQEDLPEAWHVPLLSTSENGLVGPLSDGDLIRLFRVLRKVEPTVTDDFIRPRLEERVLEASFIQLCAEQGYKIILD